MAALAEPGRLQPLWKPLPFRESVSSWVEVVVAAAVEPALWVELKREHQAVRRRSRTPR